MKLQLVVAAWSPPCQRAEQIWRAVAKGHGLELCIVDSDQPDGQALMQRLQFATIPALLIDGRLIAVGVQSEHEAHAIVEAMIGGGKHGA
jgi:hypothetical protein